MGTRAGSLLVGAALTLSFGAGNLAAQEGTWELGLDAALVFSIQSELDGFEQPNVTTFSIPEPRFRVGYFVTEQVELEGSLLFQYLKVEDFDAATFVDFGAGVNYHFGLDPDVSRFYLTGFGIISIADPGEGDSASQFGLGAGIGIKVPLGEMFAFRMEGDYVYAFENQEDLIPASSNLALFLGFSFFVR